MINFTLLATASPVFLGLVLLGQANPASPDSYLELIKAYGAGAATMIMALWFLYKEHSELKKKNDELHKVVLDITKESLGSINKMTQVVESIIPAISSLSIQQKEHLETMAAELKTHITNATQTVADAVKAASRGN